MPVTVAKFLSVKNVSKDYADVYDPLLIQRLKQEIMKGFRVVFDFMTDLHLNPMLTV